MFQSSHTFFLLFQSIQSKQRPQRPDTPPTRHGSPRLQSGHAPFLPPKPQSGHASLTPICHHGSQSLGVFGSPAPSCGACTQAEECR